MQIQIQMSEERESSVSVQFVFRRFSVRSSVRQFPSSSFKLSAVQQFPSTVSPFQKRERESCPPFRENEEYTEGNRET